jgi:hypothetical protein
MRPYILLKRTVCRQFSESRAQEITLSAGAVSVANSIFAFKVKDQEETKY